MSSDFDKQAFARLLKLAKGNRSINQYALHSGVSAAHISRLMRGKLTSPPTPQTIKRLADHAYNEITYEQLMAAAGYLFERKEAVAGSKSRYETLAAHRQDDPMADLPPEAQRSLEEFKEYIIRKYGQKKE